MFVITGLIISGFFSIYYYWADKSLLYLADIFFVIPVYWGYTVNGSQSDLIILLNSNILTILSHKSKSCASIAAKINVMKENLSFDFLHVGR